jgi:autotransporter strand-loop-strand O-heptosyltransferase
MPNTTVPTPTELNQSDLNVANPSADAQEADQAKPVTVQPKNTSFIFIDPTSRPTMVGPDKIRYDFNYGCRVELPTLAEGKKWKVRYTDMVTSNIIFEAESTGGSYQSTKLYFVPLKIELWKNDKKVFTHELCLKDKLVQVQIPVGTLGDVIAWFPYVDLFQKKHGCKLVCTISELVRPLFEGVYPNIEFASQETALPMQKDFYASYRLGLYFDDWNCTHQPVDFRYVGLHKTAAYILDVEPIEAPPKLDIVNTEREIKEPYVCIAVQSSTQSKYWNNPYGWYEIVRWLNEAGYRVLCIDKEPVWGQGSNWNYIPNGAEDFTGAKPLIERVALLKHAEFFIGLSSGLAWLAWAAGTPTVMISGFTHPNNEFQTPYRVFNHHTCNSCWNDPKQIFDHHDFMWCPRHRGTDRQFECTRLITVDHVKSLIRKIPSFTKKVSIEEDSIIKNSLKLQE